MLAGDWSGQFQGPARQWPPEALLKGFILLMPFSTPSASREDSKLISDKFHHNKHFKPRTSCRSLISHCVLIRDRCFMLPHFHSNQWHPASSSRARHRPLRWKYHFKIHSLFSGHYFTLYYDSLERRTHLKTSKPRCVTVRIAFNRATIAPQQSQMRRQPGNLMLLREITRW